MGPVEKALWFIESHFNKKLTLSAIANASDVSRYHLTRVFGIATGYSVMRYVRSRRLTEAARALAVGAPDILAVALDAGYSSHEAFTRAFCAQFGIMPKQVRAKRHLDSIQMVEPIVMNENLIVKLESPYITYADTFLIAGLRDRYTFETNHGIPLLWQCFGPYIGHIPGQVGTVTYGVCCNSDGAGNFDYIASVEVSYLADLPDDFNYVQIPAHKYAVFSHRNHISTIRNTVYTIWNQWLPQSIYNPSEAPEFERYDERFDPQLGTGVVEIWVPIN
ncbi:AraC family transcriptional regulator [Acaryochloris marina]|uniref:AraC family transcriptional regulator n=1 Tax=Acaryochloris marina TaxID=155978 RepID=UPI001BAE9074|nr:AraC family transcriptional regulator [Acaryochloris marina]QUY46176.1 AraC family transcriptional regulator [Acaryochloris marina S15]